MTDFEEAMHLIEHGYFFPEDDLSLFHNRRTAWLLEATGLSARARPTALVAGTCGKASTSRFLAFIAHELYRELALPGYLGLATKPPNHETLDGHRERYQSWSHTDPYPQWIEPALLIRWVEELKPWVEKIPPQLGAAAPYDLRYWLVARLFDHYQVDLAVLEGYVGLRNDPSRAFSGMEVAILGSIGDDHQEYLLAPQPLPDCLQGLGSKAGPVWHKASGVPPGIPLVLGRQDAEVDTAVHHLIEQAGAGPLYRLGRDFDFSHLHPTFEGSTAQLRIGAETREVQLSALGGFQMENAAQAAMAAFVLQQKGVLPGTPDQLWPAVLRGLKKTDSPGRLQIIAQKPRVIYNSAASHYKIAATLDHLRQMFAGQPRRLYLCAVLLARHRRAREIWQLLLETPGLAGVVATSHPLDGHLEAEVLGQWTRELRPELLCQVQPDPHQAVRQAIAMAENPDQDVVLLSGPGLGNVLRPEVFQGQLGLGAEGILT